MQVVIIVKGRSITAVCLALLIILAFLFTSATVLADNPGSEHYRVRTVTLADGRIIDEVVINGPPTPPLGYERATVELPEQNLEAGINVLFDVPAFDWSYGCSATSGAMLAGYYDRTGYSNMYAGPTNGGVMPMDNYYWGSGECPLSATHQGYDGLAQKGHVDDYWYDYESTNDPYYGNWTEHTYADCTADFMGTNQYVNWKNIDGSTTFYYFPDGSPLYDFSGEEVNNRRDGCHGFRLFVESRGYKIYYDGANYQNYNQYILGSDPDGPGGYPPLKKQGFTFEQYKAEIDAGRPVLIHVRGHTMLGYGYNDTTINTVYLHDTWDYGVHTMPWGDEYAGMDHIGVTVIHLQSVITSCNSSGTEKNLFVPNESVYVKGSGLEPNTEYKIWIQDNPVNESDLLDSEEDDSGSQETVTTDGNGNFGPTAIWAIPLGASITHHEYDIVVDKQNDVNTGTYNSASDGIDSATTVGFHAPIPELPTMILFSLGVLVLTGYVRQIRRKRTQ